jgi:hypothetical protein
VHCLSARCRTLGFVENMPNLPNSWPTKKENDDENPFDEWNWNPKWTLIHGAFFVKMAS